MPGIQVKRRFRIIQEVAVQMRHIAVFLAHAGLGVIDMDVDPSESHSLTSSDGRSARAQDRWKKDINVPLNLHIDLESIT